MVPIPSPLRKDLLMSCLSALLALVAVATVLPPLAAQKKEPQAERPSPLIVLREELLQEQQTLYGLETEWLLHLVKLKQRLEKVGTDMARQEAAVCAMLLGGARSRRVRRSSSAAWATPTSSRCATSPGAGR